MEKNYYGARNTIYPVANFVCKSQNANGNPRTSIWLSVDPLACYNPIFEVEHYIDGQHNGGVFNNANLNPYGYCYQSPARFVDPNGKQVESDAPKPKFSGISYIRDVINNNGVTWIDYFKYGDCNVAARKQNEVSTKKYTNPTGSDKTINMFLDKKRQTESGKKTSEVDLQKGVNTIIKNLKEYKPVMAGVMYEREKGADGKIGGTPGDNQNVATNHYITIVGMGIDDGKPYFSYYDNYVDKSFKGKERREVGINVKENRFYLYKDSSNNYYFADPDIYQLQGEDHSNVGSNSNYILTEVRDNY